MLVLLAVNKPVPVIVSGVPVPDRVTVPVPVMNSLSEGIVIVPATDIVGLLEDPLKMILPTEKAMPFSVRLLFTVRVPLLMVCV